ncbi:hypothetical protein ACFX2I_014229 [Malus domestica]
MSSYKNKNNTEKEVKSLTDYLPQNVSRKRRSTKIQTPLVRGQRRKTNIMKDDLPTNPLETHALDDMTCTKENKVEEIKNTKEKKPWIFRYHIEGSIPDVDALLKDSSLFENFFEDIPDDCSSDSE